MKIATESIVRKGFVHHVLLPFRVQINSRIRMKRMSIVAVQSVRSVLLGKCARPIQIVTKKIRVKRRYVGSAPVVQII